MPPIVHGTALVPLLRFPRGAALTIRVVMDSEISLTTHTARFAIRSRFGQTRPIFLATEPGEAWSKSGQTITLTLAPEAIDETADSELTLSDLQAESLNAYRIDFLDADEALAARLQGDLEWLAEEGAWEDEPTSTITLPEITVSIVAGAVTVTVALITGGAMVDNATVNAAIAEDAAASRTALGLGTAATQASSAFAAASHEQAISTVTGLQAALDGKATTDHTQAISTVTGLQTALDGKATTEQGAKADTAVQPNTTPSFTKVFVVEDGSLADAVLGVNADNGISIRASSFPALVMITNGVIRAVFYETEFAVSSNASIGFSGGTASQVPVDVAFQRYSSSAMQLTNGTSGQYRDLLLRSLIASGSITLGESTVGTLPTASAVPRARYEVTDASSPVVDSTVSAGGSARCEVRSNGTNWIVTKLL